MAIFDQFGQWESMGTVVPSFDWQFLPLFATTPHSTFRIKFFGMGDRTWYPPIHVRNSFFTGAEYLFDRRWVKMWPKDEPETFQLPYPADMIADPLPQRQIQVKLAGRWRYYDLNPQGYMVEIWEKTDSDVVYPVPETQQQQPVTQVFRILRRRQ
ncbi:hypothetical protein [Picosynechococcus sp. NKBG042902]|uniref:hypothetical protein n=1 Tax=Picosynechococcus sp. NKBG042902 TaxID=490193 RepID=UPI0004AABA70|nr:hypothetical protein [Picosynechococcus sp. NKBG042902]